MLSVRRVPIRRQQILLLLVDLAVLRDERDESGRWVRLELEALTVEAS